MRLPASCSLGLCDPLESSTASMKPRPPSVSLRFPEAAKMRIGKGIVGAVCPRTTL